MDRQRAGIHGGNTSMAHILVGRGTNIETETVCLVMMYIGKVGMVRYHLLFVVQMDLVLCLVNEYVSTSVVLIVQFCSVYTCV